MARWCAAYPLRPSAVAGERPHLIVTVEAGALAHGLGAAEAEHTGPVPTELHTGPVLTELARRLACDASVQRVVLAGRSEPLDVGRRTPVVPPELRRAVVVRDRGCRAP